MNKKITLGLALSLVAIASAVTFILTSFFTLKTFNKKVEDVNEKSKKYESLDSLDAVVRENFYGNINEADLGNGILKGYIFGLDDNYSRFLTDDELAEEIANDEGVQIGLGLTLSEDSSGYIRIADVLPNSPSDDADIHHGDVIIRINGTDVTDSGFDEAVASLRGSEGSSVKLTVRRDGIDTDYELVRSSIEVQSVSGEMLSGYVGYIRISAFRKNTPEQFIDALGRLTANGAKSLVFDLRDNSGGLVTAAEECLDPLLGEGVIATAEYKDGHSETIVYSDENKLDIPMVVIVNKNTASAAELFAAALRDFNKSAIVGVKTFGKGVMQNTIRLTSGGAVVLTVAECRTTVSETFNKVGILPDNLVDNTEENVDAQYNTAVELARAAS
jgi:carboxyl-terminal processing protease